MHNKGGMKKPFVFCFNTLCILFVMVINKTLTKEQLAMLRKIPLLSLGRYSIELILWVSKKNYFYKV